MSEQFEILMPSMGEGINEATLVKWLKKKGDEVRKDEPLLEVSTDKVDTEIPSPAAGFLLELTASEGETVFVNSTIAWIGNDKSATVSSAAKSTVKKPAEKARAASPATETTKAAPGLQNGQPHKTPAPLIAATGGSTRSSPLVRKIARSNDIDLAYVRGSGIQGRITRSDIEGFIDAGGPAAVRAAGQNTGFSGPAHMEYGRLVTKKDSGNETLEGVPVRREKMSKMRALIAEHMVRSVRTSPHVTTVFEIDMHNIAQTRENFKKKFLEKEGFGLTFTAFFTWAATQAIKQNPIVNVSVDGEDILWKDDINVGVAVALEHGLIVPVIKKAGDLNFIGIARRMNDLVIRARSKKLTPDEVQGGTFSITNPGMFGSIVSAPVISQPQVAILSIGAVIKRPVVIDDMIVVRPLVQIGLTFDHRVVDGDGGARYLASLKNILETFDEPVV